jgi:hypothetical protein
MIDPEDAAIYCTHIPSLVVVVNRTTDGYRARCLRCGEVGPKRGDMGEAWVAPRRLGCRVRTNLQSKRLPHHVTILGLSKARLLGVP